MTQTTGTYRPAFAANGPPSSIPLSVPLAPALVRFGPFAQGSGSLTNPGTTPISVGLDPTVQSLIYPGSVDWDFSQICYAQAPAAAPGPLILIINLSIPAAAVSPTAINTTRTPFSLIGHRLTPTGTETAMTVQESYDDTAPTSTAGPFIVPANMTRKLTGTVVTPEPGTGTTVGGVEVRIRKGVAGGAPNTTTSPIVFYTPAYGQGSTPPIAYPPNYPADGITLVAGEQFIITSITPPLSSGIVGIDFSVSVLGYDWNGS